MSQTLLTATKLTRSGVAISTTNSDETNGNSLLLTGFEYMYIKNNDTNPHTITFKCQNTNGRGQANPDIAVPIAAGSTLHFGPFQKADWAQAATGLLIMSFSAGTSTNLAIGIGQLLTNNPASDTEGSL